MFTSDNIYEMRQLKLIHYEPAEKIPLMMACALFTFLFITLFSIVMGEILTVTLLFSMVSVLELEW